MAEGRTFCSVECGLSAVLVSFPLLLNASENHGALALMTLLHQKSHPRTPCGIKFSLNIIKSQHMDFEGHPNSKTWAFGGQTIIQTTPPPTLLRQLLLTFLPRTCIELYRTVRQKRRSRDTKETGWRMGGMPFYPPACGFSLLFIDCLLYASHCVDILVLCRFQSMKSSGKSLYTQVPCVIWGVHLIKCGKQHGSDYPHFSYEEELSSA